MPRGVVRTPEDEILWKRAEAAVLPHASHYREPFAVVNFVFQRMKAAHERNERVCPKCIKALAHSKKLPRYRR